MNVTPDRAGRPAAEDVFRASFLADVLEGLGRPQKTISPKYFYDQEGSCLFDAITRLPEYYLTRAEMGLLEAHGADLADMCAGRRALVEFGSGSAQKARVVLRACPWFDVYVPCDISGEFLASEASGLLRVRPPLRVHPLVADFTRSFALPAHIPTPRAALFLGSTIGNFDPADASAILARFARALKRDARLLVGVDLVKDRAVLERAYDDACGVTARFNLNLLARIDRELGATFDLDGFRHRAVFNERSSRIEMHLVSVREQRVTVGGKTIAFAAGESIHTENSYKYTVTSFRALAAAGGWKTLESWVDDSATFSLHVLAL